MFTYIDTLYRYSIYSFLYSVLFYIDYLVYSYIILYILFSLYYYTIIVQYPFSFFVYRRKAGWLFFILLLLLYIASSFLFLYCRTSYDIFSIYTVIVIHSFLFSSCRDRFRIYLDIYSYCYIILSFFFFFSTAPKVDILLIYCWYTVDIIVLYFILISML